MQRPDKAVAWAWMGLGVRDSCACGYVWESEASEYGCKTLATAAKTPDNLSPISMM